MLNGIWASLLIVIACVDSAYSTHVECVARMDFIGKG